MNLIIKFIANFLEAKIVQGAVLQYHITYL